MGSERHAGARAFSVREYAPGDEHAITRMIGEVFASVWSLERWNWYFRQAPEGPALIHLLERDGRIVGHIAHNPSDVFVEGRRVRRASGSTTMVLPEFHGQGGMRRLVQAFLASDHGSALRMNFPNDKAAVLMPRHGGGALLGRFPRWICWRADHPGSGAAKRVLLRSGAMRAYSALASWPRPRLPIEPLTELGTEVDALAERSAEWSTCIRVRDAAYLRWRWSQQPDVRYAIHGVRGPDRTLRGWIVFSVERSTSVTGRILDVLAADSDALRALLQHAVETLTAHGCARVLFDYLDPRPWARAALLRSGFLPYGQGINVVARALGAPAAEVAESLDAWYLTIGDTERV